MPQTTYSRYNSAPGFAGLLGDAGPHRISSAINDQGADVPAGIYVARKTDGTFNLPTTSTSKFAGIVLNSYARDTEGLTGINAIKNGGDANLVEFGCIWVMCEEAMAINDPVYVRYAAGAGGTQIGAVRNDADTATARLSKGSRVVFPSTAAGIVMVFFDLQADNTAF